MNPDALSHLALIAGGLVGLWLGAEMLVRGASSLARRVGMTPLVTGLTVVALATSMPEFVVSLIASLQGKGNVAVGNAVGSNIANLALILGLVAMVRPAHVGFSLVRFHTPLLIAVCLGFVFVFRDQTVDRVEGAVLALLLIVYIAASVIYARRKADDDVIGEFERALPRMRGNLPLHLFLTVAGAALLAGGAHYFVLGASDLARTLGVSDAIVALTIVAIGTSTPELAASLVAAGRGAPDLAAGNLVGSSIFNILGILGFSALAAPLVAPGINPLDIWVMTATAALLVPILFTGFHIARVEGAILVAVYAGYIYYLWPKI